MNIVPPPLAQLAASLRLEMIEVKPVSCVLSEIIYAEMQQMCIHSLPPLFYTQM